MKMKKRSSTFISKNDDLFWSRSRSSKRLHYINNTFRLKSYNISSKSNCILRNLDLTAWMQIQWPVLVPFPWTSMENAKFHQSDASVVLVGCRKLLPQKIWTKVVNLWRIAILWQHLPIGVCMSAFGAFGDVCPLIIGIIFQEFSFVR